MSQNNRQRRAAKKRQRDARRRVPMPSAGAPAPGAWPFGGARPPEFAGRIDSDPWAPGDVFADTDFGDEYAYDDLFDDDAPDAQRSASLAATLLTLMAQSMATGAPVEPQRGYFLTLDDADQRKALDFGLRAGVEQALEHGWSPLDLYELGRRRGDAASTTYLMLLAAEWTKRFPADTIDSRWTQQLRELAGGSADDWPSLDRWAAGRRWPDVVVTLTDLAVAVMTLPVIEPVLPRPGTRVPTFAFRNGIDEAVLRRVRGLLAKAEATDFEHEAAALSAKAQTLMTQHSIDAAMASTPSGVRATPIMRRIWIDAPYVRPKSLLVSQVASANHCRTALSEQLGFVTVVGFGVDLDTTDLLSTSLLVQATRAVQQGGRQRVAWGSSNTRSYRQSFLVAYATRIGERLSEAATATESAADAEHGGSVLPVLASRAEQINAAFDETFQRTRSFSMSASDATGWSAGRTAADQADLNVRPRIDEQSA